ncbi:MAG: glycosyltransferase [Candidatus Moranbacteria bacterium]|nr:glycosyltransferase [Candidatus Moranbacteria bacterium]
MSKMQKKIIKIIHVIINLESGGAERHLLDVISHSNRSKFEHQVIVLKEAGLLQVEFKKKKIKTYILGQKTKASLSLLLKVTKILKREQPQIVMTHLFGGHLYGRLAAKLAGIKHITAVEDVIHQRETKIRLFIKKHILNKIVDKIASMSFEVKDWLIKHENIKSEKIKVIHNGINLGRFKDKKPYLKVLTDKKEIIIGTVAILKRQKGLRYLIEAFNSLKNDFPNLRLWLVGGARQGLVDNEEEYLKNQVKKYKLSQKVVFFGDRSDIPDLLNKMDIFVLPSLFEGFGIVILEAWASGLPVIASKLRCIEEYATNQKNILFTEPKDPKDLQAKIQRLIQNDELRKKMTKNGNLEVKKFDIKKTAQKYDQFFIKLLT